MKSSRSTTKRERSKSGSRPGVTGKVTEKLRREIQDRKREETELRRTQQELAQRVAERTEELGYSRDFLDQIINTIGDPIFVKDNLHRFVLVNDAICRLIGVSRENLIGQTDYEFFPKEQADVFWEMDEAILKTGVESIHEEVLTDAKGVSFTVATRKTLYTDKAGNPFIVGIIRVLSPVEK